MAGPRRDDGQVMLLIIVYTLISVAFVLVAIDAADVFLAARTLSNLADGAALAGAQAVDRSAYYAGDSPCRLPISAAGASAAVSSYLAESDLPAGWSDTAVASVTVNPATATVTVTLTHRVDLPLQGVLGSAVSRWAHGVPLSASAHASAPLTLAAGPVSCPDP